MSGCPKVSRAEGENDRRKARRSVDPLGHLGVDVNPGPPRALVLESGDDLKAQLGVVDGQASAGRRVRCDDPDRALNRVPIAGGEFAPPDMVEVDVAARLTKLANAK